MSEPPFSLTPIAGDDEIAPCAEYVHSNVPLLLMAIMDISVEPT